jgi:hypothetical protein
MLQKRSGPRTLRTYRAYNYKDKDPQIDELRTRVEKKFGRRISYGMLRECASEGGPTVGCMAGWFFKATRSPKNETLEAAGRAWGFRRKWVADSGED